MAYRAVAPIGRAPVSKTGCWGFESLQPCHFFRINMKKKLKKRNINKAVKVEQKQVSKPSRKFNLIKIGRNIATKTRIFFKEVWVELKKVSWPNRKTLISYTVVVVITVVILGLFIGLWDAAFLKLVDLLAKI